MTKKIIWESSWKGVVLSIAFFALMGFLFFIMFGSHVSSEFDCKVLIEYENLPNNTTCFIENIDARFCPVPKMVHCKGSLNAPLFLLNTLGDF